MLVKIKRPITLICSGGKKVSTYINGVSNDKVGIVFSQPIKRGISLGLKFSLPLDNRSYEFKVGGRVSHCHLRTDMYCAYIQIVTISEEHKKMLKRFLESRTAHMINAA